MITASTVDKPGSSTSPRDDILLRLAGIAILREIGSLTAFGEYLAIIHDGMKDKIVLLFNFLKIGDETPPRSRTASSLLRLNIFRAEKGIPRVEKLTC